jgi:dTDP-4-amino-4,6-dideoxygalactose transaminase
MLPEATPKSEPSWFGFTIVVRPDAPFGRADLVEWLQDHRIDTRQVFAGNLLRQPAYRDMPHRVAGSLENTDVVMRQAFWIACYPGLTDEMIDYVIDSFGQFLRLRAAA